MTTKAIFPIYATLLLALPFIPSEFIQILIFPPSWTEAQIPAITILAILLSSILLYHRQVYKQSLQQLTKVIWRALAFLIIALQILPYRVASINSVTLSPVWSVHRDAAMYALNQVHGRTSIAELPSQYRLFPKITAPIFKITGISVLAVTSFFCAIACSGTDYSSSTSTQACKNPLLSILIFVVISIPMGLFIYLNENGQDIYLQYFPIRFFWPAVILLLFSFYSSNQSRALFYLLAVTSGVTVFWNIDTGVPVLVSLAATIFAKSLITQRLVGRAFRSTTIFTIIAIGTIAVCFTLLRLKAGVPLDISEAMAYQKIFYMTGFGMIPMPLSLDPWKAVIAIYAAGAITALTAWRNGRTSKTYDVLFCSAIMGLGLFAYYQGRSHVFCLILVSWPAILISGLLTDLILRSIRNKTTQVTSLMLAIPFLVFFSPGGITFISLSKRMLDDTLHNLSTLNINKDPVVVDEPQPMRDTYRNRDCLILSQRQAIYSAELDIASPLNGPGLVETLLQADLDALVSAALEKHLQCIYLGLTEGSITFMDVQDAKLMAKYPIISKNKLGTMALLEPLQQVTPDSMQASQP